MKNANLFVDEAELEVQSGDGGNGSVGFRREKFVSDGGPNGGDGGRGGDIVLVADTNVSTLLDLKAAQRIRAEAGAKGGTSRKKGASGETVVVNVPVGTLIFDLDALEEEGHDVSRGSTLDDELALVDLKERGQQYVIARGGIGGLGNARFKTSVRQAPDFATPGKPGQTKQIRLALKLLADVGLVGFPNAGKSTLLRTISKATPRVANYPFTTLVPALGVVALEDRRCVVADIPGLIEGASDGAGLGHQFLRHVERTRVLVHLLDVEAMLIEGRDLLKDYDAIRTELERYQPDLLKRHEILVLSKQDLVHDEAILEDLLAQLKERGLEPLRISAASVQGIQPLLHEIFDAVDTAKAEEAKEEEARAKKAADERGAKR